MARDPFAPRKPLLPRVIYWGAALEAVVAAVFTLLSAGVDLFAPVVLLAALIALIATASPDPERALHRQPAPRESEKKGRRRRRLIVERTSF